MRTTIIAVVSAVVGGLIALGIYLAFSATPEGPDLGDPVEVGTTAPPGSPATDRPGPDDSPTDDGRTDDTPTDDSETVSPLPPDSPSPDDSDDDRNGDDDDDDDRGDDG